MLLARAPLRVSFFGGGTDFPEYFLKHGGAVIGTAIERFAYAAAGRFAADFFDYNLHVSYRKNDFVNSPEEIQNPLLRACLKSCEIRAELALHHIADLPSGTGLGSSSAAAVAVLMALHQLQGHTLSPMALALKAIEIERVALGESGGYQDQVLSAFGGTAVVEFRKDEQIIVTPLNLKPGVLELLSQSIILLYTGVARFSGEMGKAHVVQIGNNLNTLGLMRRQVDQAHTLFTSNFSLETLGALLLESWRYKAALHRDISNPEINNLFERGMKAGAVGGKLLGAGAGGFLLFIVPPERQAKFSLSMRDCIIIQPSCGAPGASTIEF